MRGHRPIKGFPGYWVSWKGHIYSEGSDLYLQEHFNIKGYLRVMLMPGRHWKFCHRLSCAAYHKNPDPRIYVEVHHKKFNKLKNGARDVMWATKKQNRDFNKRRMQIMAQEAAKERLKKGIRDPF